MHFLIRELYLNTQLKRNRIVFRHGHPDRPSYPVYPDGPDGPGFLESWTNRQKNVKSNEKLILDVKNEVDIIKHSLQNIVIELKKLNGKTVLDPTQVKRSNMVMVEVNTGYDSYRMSHAV